MGGEGREAKFAVACDLLFFKKYPHIRVPWSGRDVGRGNVPHRKVASRTGIISSFIPRWYCYVVERKGCGARRSREYVRGCQT